MEWNLIWQDVIAGVIGSAFTIIVGTLIASWLVPLWVRPRLKVKGVIQKGHWVSVIVKCKGREAARNAQGYLTLVTEAFHNELMEPAGDEKKYFLLPKGDAPVQVQDSLVHWAVRPNPRNVDIQPNTTSLAHVGKFIKGGFTVMSEEGYKMEEGKRGKQRMRLNTSNKEYEFEFVASADNAKPTRRIRFVASNEEVQRKPKWLRRLFKRG